MEDKIKIGLLYEFYGNLLTDKQSYVIDSYYNNDLSLSEISDELNITRQGVQKQIKDAEKILINYEKHLKLLEKYLSNKKSVEDVIKKLEKYSDDKEISFVINNLNDLI